MDHQHTQTSCSPSRFLKRKKPHVLDPILIPQESVVKDTSSSRFLDGNEDTTPKKNFDVMDPNPNVRLVFPTFTPSDSINANEIDYLDLPQAPVLATTPLSSRQTSFLVGDVDKALKKVIGKPVNPFPSPILLVHQNPPLKKSADTMDPSDFEGLDDLFALSLTPVNQETFRDAWDLPPEDYDALDAYFDVDLNPRLSRGREALERMLMDVMGAHSHLTMVIDKTVTETDINPGQTRFAMPPGQLDTSFLSAEENQTLESGRTEMRNLKVKLVIANFLKIPPEMEGPSPRLAPEKRANFYTIHLSKWGKSYILKTGWSTIVREHNLEEDMRIQIWAFRADGELCFAMVKGQIQEQ